MSVPGPYWKSINDFAKASGHKLMFGLIPDLKQASSIIKYSAAQNMSVFAYTYGNEVERYCPTYMLSWYPGPTHTHTYNSKICQESFLRHSHSLAFSPVLKSHLRTLHCASYSKRHLRTIRRRPSWQGLTPTRNGTIVTRLSRHWPIRIPLLPRTWPSFPNLLMLPARRLTY